MGRGIPETLWSVEGVADGWMDGWMAPQRVTANRKITRVTSYTAAMGHVPDNDLLADQSESHQFMLINWRLEETNSGYVTYKENSVWHN